MASNYKHLSLGERNTIENFLNNDENARFIAGTLNRCVSTISNEVRRNRTIMRGKDKGMPARDKLVGYDIDTLCPKLQVWPYVCNGCNKKGYGCKRPIKIEYLGLKAHELAKKMLIESRVGFNIDQKSFEHIIYTIKQDLKRGLSPYQISVIHNKLGVSQSTIYRWVSLGYGNMCNLDLRRKVKYKPRESHKHAPTSHGAERSYSAFCELDQDTRDAAVEMDTVIGQKNNRQCILTLYLRSTKLQICMLLSDKKDKSVADALDILEECCGKVLYKRLFGVILTDNGSEFSDHELLEKSIYDFCGRSKVYYCDIRASNQKGACEKNHTEIRKIIPKGRDIDFDEFNEYDVAYINSHINSQPKKSLCGLSPIELFKKIFGKAGKDLLDHLSIQEIPKDKLNLTYEGFKKEKDEKDKVLEEMIEENATYWD